MAAILAATSAGLPMLAYTVKGRIAEQSTFDPCIGAAYRIFAASDTVKPVATGTADLEGLFEVNIKKPGRYILKTEYVGLNPVSVPFSIAKDDAELELGSIVLSQNSETLQEVVVTAKKKLVESDGATLTYNVENDPDSKTNSTLEMLRKVPMVSIDAEENIKVNGQSSFKIFINGKEDPMLSGDPKTVLRSMPAATIKKVEVITDPGAKYDAEGTGGILNIITVGKQTIEGYMANVGVSFSKRGYGTNAYARTKIGNVTVSGNVNHQQSLFGNHFKNTNDSETENFTSDENRYQVSHGESANHSRYTGGNLNMSWEPDTLNLFTVAANVGNMAYTNDNLNTVAMQTIDRANVWSMKRKDKSDADYLWMSANASYQHTFGRTGHHIIGSYIFDHGYDDNSRRTHTYDMENYFQEYAWRNEDNHSFYNKHSLQIDYANHLGDDRHILEAGFKGSWRRDNGDNSPSYGQEEENMAVNESERVKLNQFQDIMALYASYTGHYGIISTRVGLRYEYTRLGLKYRIGDFSDFTSHLNDVVPNASVTLHLGSTGNLRAAYQMRIRRPGLEELNPYRNTMSVNYVSYGNPDLDSEKYHGVSLTYSNYGGGKIGGSVGLDYSRNDNSISGYEFMEEGIRYSTYANIGYSQSTSMNLNMQYGITPLMNFGLFARGSYNDFAADSPELKAHNHGWTYNVNANYDYTTPFKLRISAFGGVGRWIDLQSKGSGWYYYGLSLSRSFLRDDALTASVNINNLLPTDKTYRHTVTAENMRSVSSGTFSQWGVGINLTWRFGNLRSDVKRTAADIETETGGAPSGNTQG